MDAGPVHRAATCAESSCLPSDVEPMLTRPRTSPFSPALPDIYPPTERVHGPNLHFNKLPDQSAQEVGVCDPRCVPTPVRDRPPMLAFRSAPLDSASFQDQVIESLSAGPSHSQTDDASELPVPRQQTRHPPSTVRRPWPDSPRSRGYASEFDCPLSYFHASL